MHYATMQYDSERLIMKSLYIYIFEVKFCLYMLVRPSTLCEAYFSRPLYYYANMRWSLKLSRTSFFNFRKEELDFRKWVFFQWVSDFSSNFSDQQGKLNSLLLLLSLLKEDWGEGKGPQNRWRPGPLKFLDPIG